MAYTSDFQLLDYTIKDGLWTLRFLALTPPPGENSEVTLEFLASEIPSNISQASLATNLKTRLGQKLNQTYTPLNTFITNGTLITLP